MNKIVTSIVLPVFASTALAVIGCAVLQDQQTGKNKSQDTSAAHRERAIEELNEGIRACRESRYAEAQQHFVKSLEYDPTQKNALLLVARAIHVQYRPNDEDAVNIDKARKAIAAYQRVLAADPQNEEAYSVWSARIYTSPKNHILEGVGVSPDETVPLTVSDLRQGRDVALEAAENVLRTRRQNSQQ